MGRLFPVRAGIILKTENFDACVNFYIETLGMAEWFRKPELVCLRFGDGYLMVERGGVQASTRKESACCPTILRFDVDDVHKAAEDLRRSGVSVEVLSLDWGTIGVFSDPDGNPCELKNASDKFFA